MSFCHDLKPKEDTKLSITYRIVIVILKLINNKNKSYTKSKVRNVRSPNIIIAVNERLIPKAFL